MPNTRNNNAVRLGEDASGEPRLVRKAKDGRNAVRLKGDAQTNWLTRALADDPHCGPYMATCCATIDLRPLNSVELPGH